MKEHRYQNQKIKNCFYICGLTGGPFFPIPAIIEQVENKIKNTNPILIGVKNSYESKITDELNYHIEYLPKAKLDLLSFKNQSLLEITKGVFKSIVSFLLLTFSFAKCVFLLAKHKPILIYSTGSFLAVPVIWAAKLTNICKITNSKIIIHQQDSTMGLANKLTANLADLKSCVFEDTKNNYKQFQYAEVIPNPIIAAKYNTNNDWQDKMLESFVKNDNLDKPLLLIFGGGSGALTINNWVTKNLADLTKQFRIIHLTGILQKQCDVILSVAKDPVQEYEQTKSNEDKNSLLEMIGIGGLDSDTFSPKEWQPKVDEEIQNGKYTNSDTNINPNYYTQPSVLQDMPVLLANSDLVICRAGLGSISELSLLNKPTFLIPLPNSHQEQNAKLISQTNSNFKILNQINQDNWLNTVQNTKFEITKNSFNQEALDEYYNKLLQLISL
jgi:UDP-N-acetylglucosamine:LPS N-acetylglucosamine transferase